MRRLFLMFLLGSFCMLIQAQTEDSKVFDVVDQMPAFPGGQTALFQWLSNNIKYPTVAEENGVQGRVICTFVVERDGSITDVKVVKSVDPSLDKEAGRVINSMPHWIPGKQKSKPVRVKYTLPVTFRLSGAPTKGVSTYNNKENDSVKGINIKPLRDRCVVKHKGDWYVLKASLITFDEYPELQKHITKALFGHESTSIKEGYHRFVNSFEGIKPYSEQKKAKGKEMIVTLRLPQGTKARYMGLIAENMTVNGNNQTDRHLHLIFNEQTGRILTAEDILAEPYLTQYKQMAQGMPLQFHTDKSGLNYGYEINGQYHNQLVPYQDGDSVFTESFKKLINLKRRQTQAIIDL